MYARTQYHRHSYPIRPSSNKADVDVTEASKQKLGLAPCYFLSRIKLKEKMHLLLQHTAIFNATF